MTNCDQFRFSEWIYDLLNQNVMHEWTWIALFIVVMIVTFPGRLSGVFMGVRMGWCYMLQGRWDRIWLCWVDGIRVKRTLCPPLPPSPLSPSLFLGVLVHILTIHIGWSPLQNIQITLPYTEFYLHFSNWTGWYYPLTPEVNHNLSVNQSIT